MPTLLVGNNRTEEMLGDLEVLTEAERMLAGCGAQRLLWFARDGDVLILPTLPDEDYLSYVTDLTGTDRSTLHLIAPPAGEFGPDILSADRLADPGFRAVLDEAISGRVIDVVYGLHNDAVIVALAASLGVVQAVPGHHFLGQGGSALVNSKAAFRAVAAGVGAPIAPGAVVTSVSAAEDIITDLLISGVCVIVKQEYHLGGEGNEVLSSVAGIRPAGAQRGVVLPDRPAVQKYLAERWDWLTDAGRHRLVVERYFPESVPVYAEFQVSDGGVDLRGCGEMLAETVIFGEIVPPADLTPAQRTALIDGGKSICGPFHAMGYRGRISTDAFVTTDGDVIFNETNGRLTGSTHLLEIIGPRFGGSDRTLLECGGLPVGSFRDALDRLTASGLGYDPATRTGAVLICDFTAANGTVVYCVVGLSPHDARAREHHLTKLLTKNGES